jgi:outer membrane murein-binding lipoprotein Lpp
MIRTWRMLGVETVLAAALTAPAFAGQTDGTKLEDKSDTILKEVRDLKKRFDELESSLKNKIENLDTSNSLKLAQARMDLEELRKQVQQMRQDLDATRSREIAALRRDLDDMTKGRQSLYPAPAPTPTGRLQLRNTFPEMVLILVNNKPYHIFPGQNVLTDPIPAGTFNYEVVGIQPQVARTLTANETYTIHVYPR